MPHLTDIDEIKEKIYLLIQVTLAAKKFVTTYTIGVKEYEKYITKEQYWNHTKSIVSNYSIEISVKLRNAIELLESKKIKFELDKTVNTFHENSDQEKKNIREIFNKIIHAKSFQILAVGNINMHEDLLWWDGCLRLSGTLEKERLDWSFFFDILEFCKESLDFLYKVETDLKKIQLESEDLFLRRIE